MLNQILPRALLVTFLLRDTFYFSRLELIYKVILIRLIPFIFRYIKYCFKDIVNYYIEYLSSTYKYVYMFDEAYSDPSIDWERTEDNKYHEEDLTLKEYVEFRTKQIVYGTPDTIYTSKVIAKEDIYLEYKKKRISF